MRCLHWTLIALWVTAALCAEEPTALGAEKPAPLRAEGAATPWKPLWDGKTFSGWHKIGTGVWTIEDGAIVGRKEAQDKEFGHLVSDAEVGDFTIRLKFKSLKGDSGFYFRIAEKGYSGVSGFHAQVEPGGMTGALYETNGRAWVVRPSAELITKTFLPNDWNRMSIDAHGDRITVYLNDVKVTELKGDVGRRKGHLALQLHGGNDMLVMFKDIEQRQE